MSSAGKSRPFLGARRVPPSTPARQSTTVSDRVRDAPHTACDRIESPTQQRISRSTAIGAKWTNSTAPRLESLLKDDAGGALSTTMPLNSHPVPIVHRVSLHVASEAPFLLPTPVSASPPTPNDHPHVEFRRTRWVLDLARASNYVSIYAPARVGEARVPPFFQFGAICLPPPRPMSPLSIPRVSYLHLSPSRSNFAARFLAPLAAACELFGGGSSYATVLLLVVDTPYFTKWMRNNDVWYYTNYVDQLLLIDIESGNANHMLLPSSLMTHLCNAQIPPKEILQWLHLLAHLRMYAAMSRSVRKISKKKRCSVERWALCAKNQSARALYGGSAGAYDKVLISGYIFSRPFLTVSNKAIISIANL
ncbi:hypothetical protein B0H12DRAFT_1242611 [Mycena haematopus]|nr:hypothetical protein B0H12DRAFT_1242611 [Mycena haematopus]